MARVYVGPYVKVENTKRLSAMDFSDATKEELFMVYLVGSGEPAEYIIPNKDFGPKREMHHVEKLVDDGEINAIPSNTQKEMLAFRERFFDALCVVSTLFGSFELRWGVLVTENR
jgi:hypothetical protein